MIARGAGFWLEVETHNVFGRCGRSGWCFGWRARRLSCGRNKEPRQLLTDGAFLVGMVLLSALTCEKLVDYELYRLHRLFIEPLNRILPLLGDECPPCFHPPHPNPSKRVKKNALRALGIISVLAI